MSAGTHARGGGVGCENLLRGTAGASRPTFTIEPAPVTHVARLAGLFGSSFTWEAADGPSFAGLGEAAAVDVDAQAGPAALGASISKLLSEFVTSGAPADRPRPRACGGWAFDNERIPGEDWAELGRGRFVLPRWLYQTGPGRSAFLCLALTGREDASTRSRLLEQASSIRALLAEVSEQPLTLPAMKAASGDRGEWERAMEEIGRDLEAGRLVKVVLARRCSLAAAARIDPAVVLGRLARSSPRGTRFSLTRGSTTFLGASPELLVRREGTSLLSEAVAGSSRREESLDTRKNLAEHAHTVEGIRGALTPICETLDHPPRPRVRRLRHVMHLVTPFRGRLARSEHILGLVERLHPTPAVCGVPRRAALDRIRDLESFSRGWYAGPIGHFDSDGDGEFRVALRSATIHGRHATLYAGAGIVDGSTAKEEWRETEIKLRPMLAALGAGRG